MATKQQELNSVHVTIITLSPAEKILLTGLIDHTLLDAKDMGNDDVVEILEAILGRLKNVSNQHRIQ